MSDDQKYDEITTFKPNVAGVQNKDPETQKLKDEMEIKMVQESITVPSLAEALQDEKYKSMRFGVVGVGQGGSRLAEEFYKYGYPVCVANTAKQDLAFIKIPEDHKLFMDFALGGVGKDLQLGEEVAEENEKEISELVKRSFGTEEGLDIDQFVLCIGGGGGTGSGAIVPLISILSQFKLPIVVLYTLPMSNEGTVTKYNAITTLDKIAKMTTNKYISSLIVIDNSRIEEIYPNTSVGDFWKNANFDIVHNFNIFNTLSSFPSEHTSLDPMDFARILATGNCTIYGKVEIPVQFEKDEEGRDVISLEEDDIARELKFHLERNLLAEGFKLEEAVRAGIIITGKKEMLQQLPAVHINFAFAEMNDMMNSADLYRGIYVDENGGDKISIYALVSGLGVPKERIQKLANEAQVKMEDMEEEEADKTKMDVSAAIDMGSNEQNTYDKIKRKRSNFGKIISGRKNRRSRK